MNHVVLVEKLQAVGQLLGKVPRDRCLEATILFHQQCAEVAAGTIIEHKRHKFWRLKGIAQRNNIRMCGEAAHCFNLFAHTRRQRASNVCL
jgi:hypothetical protein